MFDLGLGTGCRDGGVGGLKLWGHRLRQHHLEKYIGMYVFFNIESFSYQYEHFIKIEFLILDAQSLFQNIISSFVIFAAKISKNILMGVIFDQMFREDITCTQGNIPHVIDMHGYRAIICLIGYHVICFGWGLRKSTIFSMLKGRFTNKRTLS